MDSRRTIKSRALKNMKKHYWLFLVVIMIASVLRIDYTGTMTFMHIKSDKKQIKKVEDRIGADNYFVRNEGEKGEQLFENTEEMVLTVMAIVSSDSENVNSYYNMVLKKLKSFNVDEGYPFITDKGVIAGVISSFSAGYLWCKVAHVAYSITKNSNTDMLFLMVIACLTYFLLQIFVFNVYKVVYRRAMLEGRQYDYVDCACFIRLVKYRKWLAVGWSLFILSLYRLLWTFTLVGRVIKRYSYFCVPYILAENPEMKANEAITLSRRMMNGYKWNLFKMDISFMGWRILKIVTLGFSGLFFSTSYCACFFTEYYVSVRKLAKENGIEGVELLNDDYLYELAPEGEIEVAYADSKALKEKLQTPVKEHKGIRKFLGKYMGFIFIRDEISEARNERFRDQSNYNDYSRVSKYEQYPRRLNPMYNKPKRTWIEAMQFDRVYSFTSILIMFVLCSVIGYFWEVELHLMQDGRFVNRGMLHGPWLPIYGGGCTLILLALRKLRKYPIAEFFAIIVLCGIVEYTAAFFIEISTGQKYWDYTGYMVNLHGRISAEGIIMFGVGGLAITYILAPLFDNFICRFKRKYIVCIAIVLVMLFTSDVVYSMLNPNEGEGITDYSANTVYEQTVDQI